MQRHERRFPCVDDMQRHAASKIPTFAWDYLVGGIGREEGVRRNQGDLDATLLLPRYTEAAGDQPAIGVSLFGRPLAAPFGVAPMGLNGLIWPGCEKPIAAAARAQGIFYILSTYATQDLVEMKQVAAEAGWFQLYPIGDAKMEDALIDRVAAAGYEVMVVTVDVPGVLRRDRDIRNGLSVPPRFDWRTVAQALARPHWLLRLARHGIPRFCNLERHGPANLSTRKMADYLGSIRAGHVTRERFQRLRQRWQGKLAVKGLLDPNEAAAFVGDGADAIIVSNHGGRQLDAAPSSAAQLPRFRARLGAKAPILVDGGVRCGLDIARMIALGADIVLLGRPFIFAATLGDDGPAHLIEILKQEFQATLQQLGCGDVTSLPEFLYR